MTAVRGLKKIKPIKYKESSKYPEIKKDLAFVIKKDVIAGDVLAQIKKTGGRLFQHSSYVPE